MYLRKTHYFLLLILLVLSLSITSTGFAQQQLLDREGLSEETLMHDGVEREYLLYIPPSYTEDAPLPLILNFHPLGAPMTFQYLFTQFDRYADEYPAIIVTPQGLPSEGDAALLQTEGIGERLDNERLSELLQNNGLGERLQETNFGERLQEGGPGGRLQNGGPGGRLQEVGPGGRLQERGLAEQGVPVWNISGETNGNLADDVGFVQALIDELSVTHNVDSTRIYAVGGSMGGMFSFELACQLPDTFAAVAGMSGGMTAMTTNRCEVGRPIPILQIHSTEDPLVPYESVSMTLDFWVANNQTSTSPTVNVVSNPDTRRETVIEHHTYESGIDGTVVEHYKVIGGSHLAFGLSQATGVEINREILRFFFQFDLNGARE
ncbi:MAG: dienelactone hydrolase family protein [Chloroflexota bacterium]